MTRVLALPAVEVTMEGAREFLKTLKSCFSDLKDPRVQASCAHWLIDILAITILAVTCGADDWTDLEMFGRQRHKWLKTFRGADSNWTINNV